MPTLPGRVNMTGHNTDLALAWSNNTRAVGSNQAHAQGVANHLTVEHILSRNAFSNADNQLSSQR